MWELVVISLGLGVGLAMDACAVSMANGLNEPQMKFGKAALCAVVFALFQAAMPTLGWLCAHTLLSKFAVIDKFVPIVALILLAVIGVKMIVDGAKSNTEQDSPAKSLTFGALILQAVATSIDALSVGFARADYNLAEILLCVGIVAAVTFAITLAAVYVGKKFGTKLGNKAQILGGCILVAIGLEIFITGVFF